MTLKFSVWLLPAGDQEPAIRTMIAALGRRFGTPLFAPHVTLFSGSCSSFEDVAVPFAALEALPAPEALAVEGLRQSPDFFKTFYAGLRASESLTALSQRVGARLDPDSDYVLQPHLSLLYKNMADEARQELVRSVAFPYASLRCDALALVSPGTDWRDLEAWRTLARVPLKQP